MAGALGGDQGRRGRAARAGPAGGGDARRVGRRGRQGRAPRFGDQARWLPVQRGDARSAYFTACNRGKRSVTVDLRAAGRARDLPAAGGVGRRRDHQLQAGDDGVVGPRLRRRRGAQPQRGLRRRFDVRPRGPDAGREGADLQRPGGRRADQHDRARPAASRRPSGRRSPITSRRRTSSAASSPRSSPTSAPGVGQRVDTSLRRRADLGPGQRDHRVPDDGPAGWPGRTAATRTSPGCTASSRRPTGGSRSSAWSARRARGSSRSSAGRSWRAVPAAAVLREEKAALFPLLDEVFRTRSTAEWCDAPGAMPGSASRRSATTPRSSPIRACGRTATSSRAPAGRTAETAVVAAPVRFSDTPAEVSRRPARARSAHRGGAARARLHLGRHRRAVGRRRDLTRERRHDAATGRRVLRPRARPGRRPAWRRSLLRPASPQPGAPAL